MKTTGGGVLIPVSFPSSGPRLLALAGLLAGEAAPIIPLHVATGLRWRSTAESGGDALRLLLTAAQDSGRQVHPIVRSGTDAVATILAVAGEERVAQIVLGWHRPAFNRSVLGGTVTGVLTGATVETVVFIDRAAPPFRRILVPYLFGEHDRLAVEVADRLARAGGGQVTLLHVVEPGEQADGDGPLRSSLQDGLGAELKVVETADPVGAAVAEAAAGYDAVVVGASERWGLRPTFFGLRHERLARETNASLLVVRAPTAI